MRHLPLLIFLIVLIVAYRLLGGLEGIVEKVGQISAPRDRYTPFNGTQAYSVIGTYRIKNISGYKGKTEVFNSSTSCEPKTFRGVAVFTKTNQFVYHIDSQCAEYEAFIKDVDKTCQYEVKKEMAFEGDRTIINTTTCLRLKVVETLEKKNDFISTKNLDKQLDPYK